MTVVVVRVLSHSLITWTLDSMLVRRNGGRDVVSLDTIILGDNLELFLSASWLALLRIREDTFEDVCCNKAAFV